MWVFLPGIRVINEELQKFGNFVNCCGIEGVPVDLTELQITDVRIHDGRDAHAHCHQLNESLKNESS